MLNYIMLEVKPRYKRLRVNRFKFTINNPFFTHAVSNAAVKLVEDENNMTVEQRTAYEQSPQHDHSFLKLPQNEKHFIFHLCEYDKKEDGKVVGKIVAERAFFVDDMSVANYFRSIEWIDYFCYQYEQGEQMGTFHLQGFLHFTKSMDFSTVKKLFSTMHLDQWHGMNFEARAYCCKEHTRVDGFDFVEDGVLTEEGQRRDLEEFNRDVADLEIPLSVILKKYPKYAMEKLGKIKEYREELRMALNEDNPRDVRVTYIYGDTRVGKSTSLRRVFGYLTPQYCKVGKYGHTGMFDKYKGQDILVFDEFKGKIELTEMNEYLEGEPITLPARGHDKTASYTKVFVISNYKLDDLYRKQRNDGEQPSFDAFVARFHEIIHVPERNHYVWERGKPSDEVLQRLSERGDKFTIKEQPIEQTEITEVF